MYLLKSQVNGPQDDTITEEEFGLHIYSVTGKETLQKMLMLQQKYVDDNSLLFFLRTLHEGNRTAGDFHFITYRVLKDEASARKLEQEVAALYGEVFSVNPDVGSYENTVSEISYDEFVELQSQQGTKYYFAGLADVLDEYE